MPKGPNGQMRPADVVGCAITVAKIATGEIEDTSYKSPGRAKAGRAGAEARMRGTTEEERKETARKAARGRWG